MLKYNIRSTSFKLVHIIQLKNCYTSFPKILKNCEIKLCHILRFIYQKIGWNVMLIHSPVFFVNIKKVCGDVPLSSLYASTLLVFGTRKEIKAVLYNVSCLKWNEKSFLLVSSYSVEYIWAV
jgi:hypothetical protein